jgi:hypothetical protein
MSPIVVQDLTVLRSTVFWPGLLAIMGTISPIAFLVNTVLSEDASLIGAGSPLTILLVVPILGITIAILLGFSIVFLVDRAHALIWGGLVAVLYGLPFCVFTPILLSALFQPCCSPTTISDWFWFAAETIPLAIGVLGGVWGLLTELTKRCLSNP